MRQDENLMNRYVKTGLAASVVLFAWIYAKAVVADGRYAAAPNSNKYHHRSCRFARDTGTRSLETFRSAKDAAAAGYIPCKVCNPPVDD